MGEERKKKSATTTRNLCVLMPVKDARYGFTSYMLIILTLFEECFSLCSSSVFYVDLDSHAEKTQMACRLLDFSHVLRKDEYIV